VHLSRDFPRFGCIPWRETNKALRSVARHEHRGHNRYVRKAARAAQLTLGQSFTMRLGTVITASGLIQPRARMVFNGMSLSFSAADQSSKCLQPNPNESHEGTYPIGFRYQQSGASSGFSHELTLPLTLSRSSSSTNIFLPLCLENPRPEGGRNHCRAL